jgi:hypothetical protein
LARDPFFNPFGGFTTAQSSTPTLFISESADHRSHFYQDTYIIEASLNALNKKAEVENTLLFQVFTSAFLLT